MKVKKFQMGGEVAPQQAPAQGGPEEQIVQMAQEIVGQLGPEAAMMLADAIVQLVNSSAQQAPPAASQGQPMYQRQGGKLIFKGRK